MIHPSAVVPLQQSREAQAIAGAVKQGEKSARAEQGVEARLVADANGDTSYDIASGGTIQIYHQLGRQPKGWRLVDLYATATIGAAVRRTAWDADTLTLANDAGVAVTVSVEVF